MEEPTEAPGGQQTRLFLIGITLFSWYLIQQPQIFFQARPDEIRLFQAVQALAEGRLDIPPFSAVLPFVSLPMYGLGRLAAVLTGQDVYVKLFTHVTNSIIAVVLLLLFYRFANKIFKSSRVSTMLTLALGMATPLNFFSVSFYNEVTAALFIFIPFVLLADRDEPSSRKVIVAGFICGISVLNRVDAVMALGAMGLYVGLRRRKQLVPFAVGSVVGLGIVALIWLGLATEQPMDAYTHARFTTPPWIGISGYLFSFGRSIFIYSPIVVLSVVALRRFRRKFPEILLLIGLIVGMYLLLYIHFWSWHNTWGWGPRYLVKLFPLLILPAGECLRDIESRIWELGLAVFLCLPSVFFQIASTAVNYQNALIYLIELMDQSQMNIMFNPYLSPMKWHLEEFVASSLQLHYFWFDPRRILPCLILLFLFGISLAWLVKRQDIFQILVARKWVVSGAFLVLGCLLAIYLFPIPTQGLERRELSVGGTEEKVIQTSKDGWIYEKWLARNEGGREVRWRGEIYLTNTWNYQFGGVTRGQLSIWIDGRQVLKKKAQPAGFLESEEYYLKAGWHRITIHFRTRGSGIFKFLIFSPKKFWRLPWPSELRRISDPSEEPTQTTRKITK